MFSSTFLAFFAGFYHKVCLFIIFISVLIKYFCFGKVFPQQNINHSETKIGGPKLSEELYVVVQSCQWTSMFHINVGELIQKSIWGFHLKKLWNITLTHFKQITLKDCSTTFFSWKYYNQKCYISIITAAFKASVKTNRMGSEDLPQQAGFCH